MDIKSTSTLQKSGVPQIRGVKGEAPLYKAG